MEPATLETFSAVNDAAAATTKKLVKQQVLADYFRGLDETDLPIAVRFSGGRVFAATDERVLGVSGAIVSDAVLPLLKISPREFYALAVKHGEMGEALSVIWKFPGKPGANPRALSLQEIFARFEELASTGNIARKKEIAHDLFARCQTGREAAYLAKIIFSDLRTGVREGVLHDAIARSFGRTREAVQRAQLMSGDLGDVALLAKRDQLSAVNFRLFHPIQFMLATPKETAAEIAEVLEGQPYIIEDKLDGIRAQIHKSGGGPHTRIAIYTRTMDRTDESFPDVVSAIAKVPGEFLLDGEIVPFRDGRVLPFAHIQKRLGRKVLSAKILRENPATFIAFDMLYLNGELLMDLPLRQRRAKMESIAGFTVLSAQEISSSDAIERAFGLARDAGNEGLVLKDPASPYTPGRRGQAWLKLKTHLPTLDCVVTAAEYGHGKRKNSLSDYTFAVWDREPGESDAKLLNIGKAYSGVTDAEIAQLTKLFLEIAREQIHGRVFLVEPKIVLEIAFDQIQPSDRHESGFALRFPRIKRIRWDKSPADADRIARVKEIYEHAHNMGRRVQVEEEPPEPTLFDHLD